MTKIKKLNFTLGTKTNAYVNTAGPGLELWKINAKFLRSLFNHAKFEDNTCNMGDIKSNGLWAVCRSSHLKIYS